MLLADWHYMDTRERQGKQIHLNSKPPGKRAEENCLIEKCLFFRPLTLLLTFDGMVSVWEIAGLRNPSHC